MAEGDVPAGPRKPRKVLLYVAGAAGVYVLYRYWKGGQRTNTATGTGDPSAAGGIDSGSVTDYPAGAGAASGNIQWATAPVTNGPATVTTNADWLNGAVSTMAGLGWDAQTATLALSKYLQRQGLSDSEVILVRVALGVAGPPPTGGPYEIIPAVSPGNPGAGQTPAPKPKPSPAPKPKPAPKPAGHTVHVSAGNTHAYVWKIMAQYGKSLTALRILNPWFKHGQFATYDIFPPNSDIRIA